MFASRLLGNALRHQGSKAVRSFCAADVRCFGTTGLLLVKNKGQSSTVTIKSPEEVKSYPATIKVYTRTGDKGTSAL
ncbi:hypothetical protein LPJ72_002668, partial [Coemansia sp. Benny D160-2]